MRTALVGDHQLVRILTKVTPGLGVGVVGPTPKHSADCPDSTHDDVIPKRKLAMSSQILSDILLIA
jgi:hypothetical protein